MTGTLSSVASGVRALSVSASQRLTGRTAVHAAAHLRLGFWGAARAPVPLLLPSPSLAVVALAAGSATSRIAPAAGFARRATPPVSARGLAVAVRAAATKDSLQTPHGGSLVNLMVTDAAAAKAGVTKTIECSDRNACDVEILGVGGFSPLTGFLSQADYESVVNNMRLANGTIFGLPIVMDTRDDSIKVGDKVLLTYQGQDLAVLTVSDKYIPDKVNEAKNCYGTTSLEHPAVRMISMERGNIYLGGKVEVLALPKREYPTATPAEVRATLPKGKDVVAFQCRNPIHRAHYELFVRSLDAPNVGEGAVVLVHPTMGPTQEDDISGLIRYETYKVLKEETKNESVRWAYLPYSMHMAGPREAIQHMIIRKNYGCTHFIIGRDMAGCKSSVTGEDFYGAFDAQDTANANAAELGMQTVPSRMVVYTEEEGYVYKEEADERKLTVKTLSGTKFRAALRNKEEIPEWFAFKSVVKVLAESGF